MYYIGIDLGGTNIVVAIVDEYGNIIESVTSPTIRERSATEIFEDIHFLIESVLGRRQLTTEEIVSIGIGVPGNIDINKKEIIYANNLNMDHFPVVDFLAQFYQLPIHLANDADCALIGEFYYGSGKGHQDVFMVTIGTGIGGSAVINKQLFSGYFPGGTEIGHMIIERGGALCTCGNHGCFEAYASASGLANLTEHMISKKKTILSKMIKDNGNRIDAKMVFDAAEMKDPVAIEILDVYYDYLAIGISNLINIFTPELVIIGGGVSMQKDNLLMPLREKVSQMVYGFEMKSQLISAALGNNAGLIGAAMLHKQFN